MFKCHNIVLLQCSYSKSVKHCIYSVCIWFAHPLLFTPSWYCFWRLSCFSDMCFDIFTFYGMCVNTRESEKQLWRKEMFQVSGLASLPSVSFSLLDLDSSLPGFFIYKAFLFQYYVSISKPTGDQFSLFLETQWQKV